MYKVLRKSKRKFHDTVFTGECKTCGVIFAASIKVLKGLNGSIQFIKPLELSTLEFKHGKFMCKCPECSGETICLVESDDQEEI